MLDVSQAAELKFGFRRARGSNGSIWTNEAIKKLSTDTEALGGVLDVLDGRSKIVPVEKKVFEDGMDPIIRVDRKIFPVYGCVGRWKHPALQCTGPAEFNVEKLEFWLHPDLDKIINGQPKSISGTDIHLLFKGTGELERCLNIRDGEEIKKRGIDFFRKYFEERKKIHALGVRGLEIYWPRC